MNGGRVQQGGGGRHRMGVERFNGSSARPRFAVWQNVREREFAGRENGTFKGSEKRCLKNTINKPDAGIGVLNLSARIK